MRKISGLVAICFFIGLCTTAAHAYVADPYDGYSMPGIYQPEGFESIATILTAGDVVQRAKEFYSNKVSQVERNGLKWVRWNVKRKQNSRMGATLGFRYDSRVKPEKYELTVFNNGQTYVDLSADGDPIVTVKSGEEKMVTFETAILNLSLPTIKDETEYDIFFRGLKIYYPSAENLKVLSIESSNSVRAGKEVSFKIVAEGQIGERDIDLEVRRGRWVLWRIRLDEAEKTQLEKRSFCSVARKVPWYLPAGGATVGLVAEGRRVEGVEKTIEIINTHSSLLPQMDRRNYNGRPTFFKNGRPYTWTGYATYNYQPGVINEFGQSGANVFWLCVAAGKHLHHVAAPTWFGADNYNFEQLQQRVCTGLQANPDADFVLRINLGMPHFWYDENPDSRVLIRTESGDIVWEETSSIGNSIADKKWRQREVKILNKLVDYVRQQPWAERIIAFLPGCEVTEEWFAWACNNKKFSDYSRVNERAFQKWLRKSNFDFDRIPDPGLRDLRDYDIFPDTKEGRWAAAYNKFYNELTAETVCYFAKALKEASDQRTLVGVLYGYVIQLAGEFRQSTSGNFDLRTILDSPDIDYIMGIPLHTFRYLTGTGYDTYTSATASIQAAGKLYNNEDDLFSWLHPAHWHKEYDPKDPRGAAISMHRRVLADDAVHGCVRQWFSLSPEWHHDEQLQAEFAKQIKLHSTTLQYDRTPTEEIAFVVDDTSFSWFTATSKYPLYSHHFMMSALGRTGAPLSIWLLSDIDKLPERIKFVLVTYCPAAKKEDIEKLKKMIERGGRTIVLIGTTGLVDPADGTWHKNATAELTGLGIRIEDEPGPCRAYLPDGEEVCNLSSWKDIYVPNEVEPSEIVNPRGYVDGEGWMKYKDGKTAGTQRRLAAGGKLIWCGVPPFLNVELLRNWLEEAGVHFYGPVQSFVYSSRELVAITWVGENEKTLELNWPERVEIEDLFDGWKQTGKTTRCPFEPGQTRLFSVKESAT